MIYQHLTLENNDHLSLYPQHMGVEVQYASHQYRKLLNNNGFIGSMSKRAAVGIMPLLKASLVA